MKNVVVIGLGNFGMNISKTLMENNCEVLGIDSEKENVQKAMDFVSHAIIGDASNKAVLRSLSVKDFDAAVVSIGQEMGTSILIWNPESGVPVSDIVIQELTM